MRELRRCRRGLFTRTSSAVAAAAGAAQGHDLRRYNDVEVVNVVSGCGFGYAFDNVRESGGCDRETIELDAHFEIADFRNEAHSTSTTDEHRPPKRVQYSILLQ